MSLALRGITFDIPGQRNHDPLALRLDRAWLDAQRCPEHPTAIDHKSGLGWSHVRAHWAAHERLVLAERPAVEFLCPMGHVWQVVLQGT